MDVFTSFSGEPVILPDRFAALKRQICTDPDKMIHSWQGLLRELEGAVEEIAEKGANLIPQVSYSDVERGLTEAQVKDIKKRGVVIVKGGVLEEEALGWKESIKSYVRANSERVRGGPPGRIVFYELYNSPAQIRARTHPALLTTQRALLSLWHMSSQSVSPLEAVSLRTPISYFDRLRIRPPGPSVFTLGPHIDWGRSDERWEDPAFRACFGRILESEDGEGWRSHDPFDVAPRLAWKQDVNDSGGNCSVFRPWQGWTALSHTGPGEGTLRVLPLLSLTAAYVLLRPFFRLQAGAPLHSLKAEDWELDLESTVFHGCAPMKTQELSERTHPHLRLDKTLLSIPQVAPGDQVFWHCDTVHAVEGEHNGKGDSSVLYIPAIPLTHRNAIYLREQRAAFLNGLPAPDFPGGEGESKFIGRATANDVKSLDGQRLFGLAPFEVPPAATQGEARLIETVNSLMF
ncbi:hypothetical protein POSPLADRAFT_1048300 [Postia placenta MAD-698-R-SB12]|uniref:DUF1479 domain protein n=1 Tax=Postia placenta MAD-698-R-SB12 TaxID=670580 RepID=A0A1X6MUG2_9APHY|nr:hypothetical protein POSPLADRAFT_1048300 [Postia placenta MAD-698-R-SB12]OSX59833.1 hypothetical protein POSPLADRAFT_1048300 [Postia placenta MAD-698-R-SB12]